VFNIRSRAINWTQEVARMFTGPVALTYSFVFMASFVVEMASFL
jgi:hypothetical protein